MAAAAAPSDGDGDDEARRRHALREAFGNSSESDSDAPLRAGRGRWRWEGVKAVRGLWLCAAFLSADEQSHLLAAIQREGWFSDAHNQAMRFGDLPTWAAELAALIHEAVCVGNVNDSAGTELTAEDEDACPLPSDLLWREPLFDQLIANRYKPAMISILWSHPPVATLPWILTTALNRGHNPNSFIYAALIEGICAHVDLMRFDDGIAIVSLESACVMHFSQAEPDGGAPYTTSMQGDDETTKIPVYLSPGSLVLMSGEARYLWKHEINRKHGSQLWDGRELEQGVRTSITLRKLRASPN